MSLIWDFFLYTLFQFDLAIAPIQNTGLVNAKYNNTSGKYNKTLYGTIKTTRLNIFHALILHKTYKILESIWRNQTKSTN